ncbi:hypothetical protein M2272_005407 [Mycobacterium frederiksbergense]|uniref:Uncharacterized protein n=1 Tax=Mycolicibacterium frederiksbergense TaxID=117567 RepID=A0ABT6L712_9MYCO|nr:hypothetical protein [Mycolicibacterium frederiksbergense]MDH6198747.1 hypothetical protein [Mycolicibacterium frederiksbergense]
MTLTDPRDALAEQSSFIGYLMGLANLGRMVRALAADAGPPAQPPRAADDLVYLLLGVASLGTGVEKLAGSVAAQRHQPAVASPPTLTRWLR